MNDTIQALIELQRVDDEIGAYVAQRDDLATNLENLRGVVDRMNEELDQKRERLDEASGFYKEKQIDLQADGERLSRAKAKLGTVTRTKEYAAIQRELDTLRKKYSEDEAELKRLAEAMEEYKVSIAAEEAKISELKGEVERETAASAARLEELEGQIAEIEARKASARGRLDRSTLSRYERVLKRREGKAVIAVIGGKCNGCQMMLPPQMYVVVQRGDTVQTCPTCQRYLFMEEYPEANYSLDEVNT